MHRFKIEKKIIEEDFDVMFLPELWNQEFYNIFNIKYLKLFFDTIIKSDNVYLGLSSTHLNQPTIESSSELMTMARHYYLSAGYNHDLNPQMVLMPSIFIKSDGVSSSMDISTPCRVQ